MYKVIVVDDHPFVRASVKALLSQDGFDIVGETGNGQEAIRLVRDLQPDLIVLDIGIPDLDGFEVINRLSGLSRAVKVLVLSTQSPEQFSIRCKHAGAAGYVCKNDELAELSKAARAVMSGYTYFPNIAFSSVRKLDGDADEQQRLGTVSDREMRVLQQLAKGFSNKQIADTMFLSNKTISTYKSRLLEKLELKSVVELAELAKRNGLI
ncbi:response regulator [Pseudomonas rustica]|jgi:two-component system response regulator EvgA|uniref:response regulator transcription factor n=1 Tax=Pseudomonas TaxID=286 RepID=UPI00135C2344|nr:response regulator transcription factor [Pseudomonas sp. 18058]